MCTRYRGEWDRVVSFPFKNRRQIFKVCLVGFLADNIVFEGWCSVSVVGALSTASLVSLVSRTSLSRAPWNPLGCPLVVGRGGCSLWSLTY